MALVTCRTTIVISVTTGTHLHLGEVEHLKVKYIAQGHIIDTTMSQRGENQDIYFAIVHALNLCGTQRLIEKCYAVTIVPRPSLCMIYI